MARIGIAIKKRRAVLERKEEGTREKKGSEGSRKVELLLES